MKRQLTLASFFSEPDSTASGKKAHDDDDSISDDSDM